MNRKSLDNDHPKSKKSEWACSQMQKIVDEQMSIKARQVRQEKIKVKKPKNADAIKVRARSEARASRWPWIFLQSCERQRWKKIIRPDPNCAQRYATIVTAKTEFEMAPHELKRARKLAKRAAHRRRTCSISSSSSWFSVPTYSRDGTIGIGHRISPRIIARSAPGLSREIFYSYFDTRTPMDFLPQYSVLASTDSIPSKSLYHLRVPS